MFLFLSVHFGASLHISGQCVADLGTVLESVCVTWTFSRTHAVPGRGGSSDLVDKRRLFLLLSLRWTQ